MVADDVASLGSGTGAHAGVDPVYTSRHPGRDLVDVNVLTAPLRPIADVLDLTAEAVAALGTLSVGALTVVLTRTDDAEYPALTVVESPSYR